ncbi:hypothetical protein JB92DRAFT_3082994 [Gautieria morchelliformis]|nr:hypothetical protein JB92DRAFT_3082994 [Gautieria morchelliformis]
MRLIKEYCCCAIPLLNVGIYTTLTEQFVVSVTAAILALVTPPIVGASVPSFVPIVFAALCFVAAAVQLLGFMAVFRARPESTITFRRYTTLHLFIVTAIFAFSAVFIGISASKHSTATTNCIATFFPTDPTVTTTALTGSQNEGRLLCNIFTWVGLGTLGGLWLVLGIFHAYLFFVISGYGSSQRADHSKYYSLYSINSYPGPTNEPHPSFLPPDHIGMQNMGHGGDAWDARDSMDNVGFEKPQAYNPNPATYAPPHRQASDATLYPGAARTMSPAPTAAYQTAYDDPYYSSNAPPMGRPEPNMRYSAEGSFHRKTQMTPAPQEQLYADGVDQRFVAPR